ncbi:isochorismatase family protein [Pengzhenrongella sicca]|uniref:Isochorismatase family protein n=1 Tax=Pengzhenrongella sicca TaxID=2819238 RepID=A0A8A4ZAW4_9MICO|nr:isochorismatase family protein [Pengzhenrongella sicca]QTE28159.1 isochorismatase family protein [Pengzhenrongella sicca]
MTTITERPQTALVVIDVQNGVVEEAHLRDEVVATVHDLVERARREHVPVVWVQHDDDWLTRGSDAWQIVPELAPDAAEPLVAKHYGDAFEETSLESVLAGLEVGRLVVVGAETDACVRSTLHGAFVRGYDVTLVADGHTTGDKSPWGAPTPAEVIAHTNMYWGDQDAPGRTAAVARANDVDFAP